ncbi:MAG: HNH endonuclease signature motif containing protein [Candidatus Paceibacterota bacterium]|jgi:5-methylcytosine-specific restriction protein A
MRPKHQCRYSNCHELTDKTYCPEHEQIVKQKWQKQADGHRGTAAERGYDNEWAKYRLSYLKEHPLCVECEKEGRYIPSKDVDHIIPVKGQSDPLFWKPDNHQGLCHRHHCEKTARENSGMGNKRKRGNMG